LANYLTRIVRTAALLGFVLATATVGTAETSAGGGDQKPLIGRWDLTIKDSKNNQFPSWLELSVSRGEWKARFVGRWGHARFLPAVTIKGDTIRFVSPGEEEGSKTDLIFDGKLEDQVLVGTAQGPDGTPWKWSGKRAPVLAPSVSPKWGEPVTLFNGR